MKPYVTSEDGPLLATLIKAFPSIKRTKLKQLLKYSAVTVNGKTVEQHDHALHAGDSIAIKPFRPEFSRAPKESSLSFPLLYEDEWIIAVDKPAGLLTMGTDKEKVRTAYFELTSYVRGKSLDGQGRIFIVHRLDRDASGVLIFAKDEESKFKLQENWDKVEKKYYAIVEGTPEESSGTIESYLTENKVHKVYSTEPSPASKLAITHYRVVSSAGHYALVEVAILTGRKNQIRVHMADMGHPLIGDEKYGSRTDPAGRLGLHAFELSFDHPATGERLTFTSPLPDKLRLKGLISKQRSR